MGRSKPLIQRNLTALIEGANGHSERLTTSVALIKAGAGCRALHQRGFVNNAAMRTNRTMRPEFGLQPYAGLIGIVENWVRKNVALGHGHLLDLKSRDWAR